MLVIKLRICPTILAQIITFFVPNVVMNASSMLTPLIQDKQLEYDRVFLLGV
jgi:hypothetical protein